MSAPKDGIYHVRFDDRTHDAHLSRVSVVVILVLVLLIEIITFVVASQFAPEVLR